MLNIGNRPTIGNGEAVSVEVNLFEYDGNLYGQRIVVEFVSRLRDERRFASRDELMNQLAQDEETTRQLLNL
jgi:riboflavin kinase/FMN adenylyltransferase